MFQRKLYFVGAGKNPCRQSIFVEEELVELSELYRKIELKAHVTDLWAHDRGFVFLMSDTIGNVDEEWEKLIIERKARYSMKIRRALEEENL